MATFASALCLAVITASALTSGDVEEVAIVGGVMGWVLGGSAALLGLIEPRSFVRDQSWRLVTWSCVVCAVVFVAGAALAVVTEDLVWLVVATAPGYVAGVFGLGYLCRGPSAASPST